MYISEFVDRCREIRNGSPNAFYALVDTYCRQADSALDIEDVQRRCRATAERFEAMAGPAKVDTVISADLLLKAASLLRGYHQSLLLTELYRQTRDGVKEWRCFHCDEVFTEEAEAREHFGLERDGSTPACRLTTDDVRHLRALEDQNATLRAENDRLDNDARLYHELQSDVDRRTNGHGLLMHLDYLEGEKLVLQERVAVLELAALKP